MQLSFHILYSFIKYDIKMQRIINSIQLNYSCKNLSVKSMIHIYKFLTGKLVLLLEGYIILPFLLSSSFF